MITTINIKKLHSKREAANILLFSLGKLMSVFGSAIYTFALGLYVLKITGSGLIFATTLILGIIPAIIINPFAGVLADKFNKKILVITMDILSGIFLVAIYFVSSIYGLSLLIIYISIFVISVFTAIFGINIESAKPNIVSDNMLMNINSISKIIDSASLILGPMLGGIVYAFVDIKFFILINGLSFIFSAILEIFIDFKYNSKNNLIIKTTINFFKDIKEGLIYIKERDNLISFFSIFISLNFFIGYSVSVPLPYIINEVLKLSSKELGIIQGAFPLGMIIGALLIKKISEKFSYDTILLRASLVLSICMIIIGLPSVNPEIAFSNTFYLFYYVITMIIFGIAISFIDIPILYMLQRDVPDEYRGRVLSIGMSLVKIILPVALIISGILLTKIPAFILPITGGVLLFPINLWILKKNRPQNTDLSYTLKCHKNCHKKSEDNILETK